MKDQAIMIPRKTYNRILKIKKKTHIPIRIIVDMAIERAEHDLESGIKVRG